MPRTISIIEAIHHVLIGLNERSSLLTGGSLSIDTRSQQILSCINRARQYINYKGSFTWDKYFGTIITVDGINSYELTPDSENFVVSSRDTSVASLVNVTVVPKNKASFDDTFNLAKCTATGAAPSVARASLTDATLFDNLRMSASVWLMKDTTNDPGTITLTLTDAVGGQSVTKTISNDGTLKRYGISGFFNSSTTGLILKVSWTSATGIVYLDAWQIENNDWPSENIHNYSAVASAGRNVFANPDRLNAVCEYLYNTRLTWNKIVYPDGVERFDHTTPIDLIGRYFSMNDGMLNLENVPADTHLVYRGNKKAPVYDFYINTTIDIPDPEYWILISGVIAHQKQAIYDIGTNKEADSAMSRFDSMVEDMVNTSGAWPGYSYVQTLSPAMMR